MKSIFELEIDCQACAAQVLPVTLETTDGIENAELDGDKLTVEHDPETVAAAKIADMLEESGYTVKENRSGEEI
ncbi:MAG: cation transporter [Candidatus Nanohaloarchaea archaeon]|nr:cation transporter [Candidatus Nanohaloarchaea archaeon]